MYKLTVLCDDADNPRPFKLYEFQFSTFGDLEQSLIELMRRSDHVDVATLDMRTLKSKGVIK